MDRRALPREPVELDATIVSDDGLQRVEGTLINMTTGRATIVIPVSCPIPFKFYLLMQDHRLQPCHIVWRQGQLAGLQFDY